MQNCLDKVDLRIEYCYEQTYEFNTNFRKFIFDFLMNCTQSYTMWFQDKRERRKEERIDFLEVQNSL